MSSRTYGGTPKTALFPMSVKPVRRGVYEVQGQYGTFFSQWTGHQWCYTAESVRAASKETGKSSDCYDCNYITGWRGLIKETK